MSTKEDIKLGRLARDTHGTQIRLTRAEGESLKLSFPLSSEAPVERWFGTEILSHEAKSVRMDRLAAGAAPLLFNHDWSDPIGMIDGARIEDGRLWVDAHLFSTARAQEVAQMVEGGLRNVSVGYDILELTEDVKRNVYTATEWMPLEGSICTVPADITVGINRSDDAGARPVRMVRDTVSTTAAPAAPKEKAAMAETTVAENPQQNLDPLKVERDRREAIGKMCKASNIDSRLQEQWVRDGATLEQVASHVLTVMEERGKANPTAGSDLGLSKREVAQFSLFRAIRALRFGATNPKLIEEAAYEREVSMALAQKLGRDNTQSILVPGEVLRKPLGEAAQRAMSTTPGSKGGYLVNVENMGFIDILRNRSVSMTMGARILSGLQGNVMFPRQTGKPSVTWQAGEGVSVTAADQTLGQLSMTPKTAIAITDVSEQLLRQSSPDAEAFVMADLAADIAIDGVDYAVINGTGGAQPLGIKNTAGVTTGQDAGAITYAKALAFASTAAASNAIRTNPGWVTNAAGAAILMQRARFANTDTPLWEGNILDGTCVGFRSMASEQIASGNLIFGSWGDVVIGEWGVLELATDNGGTRLNAAQVGIRAMWMVDVLVRYPQAFVVSTNLS